MTITRALHNYRKWEIEFMEHDFTCFMRHPAVEAERKQRQLSESISVSCGFAAKQDIAWSKKIHERE